MLTHRIHDTAQFCDSDDIYTDVAAAFAKIKPGQKVWFECDDEPGSVYVGDVAAITATQVTMRSEYDSEGNITVTVNDVEAGLWDSEGEEGMLLLMKKEWKV